MDPVSLAASIATLTDLSLTVSKLIIKYIGQVQNPDDSIRYLRIEIDTLSTVLKSFRATLNDPPSTQSFSIPHSEEYWKSVGLSIQYCQQTIEGLEGVLDRAMGGQGGVITRLMRPIKLGLKADEISIYRQQIISYRDVIGFAIQWMSAGLRSQELTVSHAEKLEVMLQRITNDLTRLMQQRQAASTESARAVLENLESCVRSARTLVSTTSSIFTGSLVDRGSISGSSLNPEQFQNIVRWIPPPASSTTGESEMPSSDPGFPPSISTPRLDGDTDLIRSTSDSTADFQMKVMIQYWREKGLLSFQARLYNDAEELLRRAYAESASRYGIRFEGWQWLIKMLIVSHCKLGHLDEAERILSDVLKESVTHPNEIDDKIVVELTEILASKYSDDGKAEDAIRFITGAIHIKREKRLYFLDSQRTLAELYFKKGDLSEPRALCINIIDGTPENSVEYRRHIVHEATILMVLICNAEGDHVEGDGRKKALPLSYQSFLMIDTLCYMTPCDAICELLINTNIIQDHIAPEKLDNWKQRARSISENHSNPEQCPFLFQTFVNHGDEHHVERLLTKWNYDEYVNYIVGNGGTVLIEASIRGSKEIVSLLCKYGAAIDVVTTDGWTALHCAAYYNHGAIIDILLERSADTNIRTIGDYTALDLARGKGHREIVRVLEANHAANSGVISTDTFESGNERKTWKGGVGFFGRRRTC